MPNDEALKKEVLKKIMNLIGYNGHNEFGRPEPELPDLNQFCHVSLQLNENEQRKVGMLSGAVGLFTGVDSPIYLREDIPRKRYTLVVNLEQPLDSLFEALKAIEQIKAKLASRAAGV